MRTIGIREPQAQLSRVRRDVLRGELYPVTDRGNVAAELRPPGGSVEETLSPAHAARRALHNAGELRIADGVRAPYRRSAVRLPERASQGLLDWVRGSK